MTISQEEFARIGVGSILKLNTGIEATVIGRLLLGLAVTYNGCPGPRVDLVVTNSLKFKGKTYREKWSIALSVDDDVRFFRTGIDEIESIVSFCLHTSSPSNASQINESVYEERKRAAKRYCGTADGETPEAQTRNGGMRFL